MTELLFKLNRPSYKHYVLSPKYHHLYSHIISLVMVIVSFSLGHNYWEDGLGCLLSNSDTAK
jgi:hypothetical protein